MRTLVQIALVLCITVAGGQASAGGGVPGGGATEMTQLMNNAELVKSAADQARTASTTMQQYYTQLQQFQLQRLAGMALDKLPAGLGPDLATAMASVQKYQGAVTQLRGSLTQQSTLMDQRITEAQLLGRDPNSWARYTQRVQSDISSGKQSALIRMQQEQTVLQQVQKDYEYARNVQDQLPALQGQQQSLTLLNAQMNRVVQQNAGMLQVMSATIAKYGEDSARDSLATQKAASMQDVMSQRQKAIEDRQRSWGGLPQ